ncbi:MAG TPA: response regulator transcription factor [Bryobacteraceae bacterium]|nr:response regulator transcription factor [Bryobacteraceae bacterium]
MTALAEGAVKILLVDDHAMFREGVARLLEKEPPVQIVGQCGSSAEALANLKTSGANMILLDVDLGTERAVDFLLEAHRRGFEGRVLVVTAGVSPAEAVQLVRSGVSGIVHKHQSGVALWESIQRVAAGGVWLEDAYLGALFKTVDRSKPQDKPALSEREKHLLRFIFQGLTNKEIGGEIGISEGAVKASLRQLFEKLKVRTRAQAVKVALEQYRHEL